MFGEFRQHAKEALRQKHITYSQLGELIQVQESTIKGFMCGASDSRRIAEKIADGLGIALRYENGRYVCEENKEEST